ncbi:hypothetical protein EVAR_69119_1 [Eumeta japonica]|uniref:Uncharacterized protein n=1 Tax=Eumeta variegata TaxID=151549 RepID=A0A4C1T5Y3_EUMVA|nr:hypothetical protein EVAR_69119_1 [Eumeta japonica]
MATPLPAQQQHQQWYTQQHYQHGLHLKVRAIFSIPNIFPSSCTTAPTTTPSHNVTTHVYKWLCWYVSNWRSCSILCTFNTSMISSGSSSGRTGFDAYSHSSLYAQQNQRHILAAGSSPSSFAAHHSAAHAAHPIIMPSNHFIRAKQSSQASLHHHPHHQQHQHYYHHAQQAQTTPLHRPHTQIMPQCCSILNLSQ